jgi:hypothetical protein
MDEAHSERIRMFLRKYNEYKNLNNNEISNYSKDTCLRVENIEKHIIDVKLKL